MVHPFFCVPLSFLAALFINQRKQRQHSSLRKGLTLRSNKKIAPSSYYFVKEICDQSKSLVHIITWLKARSWKCEIWIRSYPWIWMDTSYAKGETRLPFQKRTSRELLFNNIHHWNTILSFCTSQIFYEKESYSFLFVAG